MNAIGEKGEIQSSDLIQGLAVLLLLGGALKALWQTMDEIGQKAEQRHLRAARAKAWRLRRSWRTADIPRLEAYGFSGPAYDRYLTDAHGRRRGRGVIAAFTPLPEAIMRGLAIFKEIADRNPPLDQRRTLLRKTAIEPLIIEGLYRGAYEDMHSAGVRGASVEAEAVVADIMAMSPESVHQHCNTVRKKRKSTGLRTLTVPEVAPGFYRALILPHEDEPDA
jgi:hypothetical protein